MFKSENLPNWFCALLALWTIIQQNIWRKEDALARAATVQVDPTKLPIPLPPTVDLSAYWISDGVLILAIFIAMVWWYYVVRPRGPQVNLIEAEWGNEHSKTSVLSTVNRLPRNGLTFHVDPHTLKCDPAPGVDAKYVNITYSFPGRAPATLRRKQHDWVVLPEDPWLKGENQHLTVRVAELEKERDDLLLRLPKPKEPEPEISDVEFQWRQKMRGEFGGLRWAQRIALKRVCECPGTQVLELVNYLHADLGFGDPPLETIVDPLLRSGLVFINLKGGIEVLNGRVDFVHKLIMERPLC